MALNATEDLRIQSIEKAVNNIQTALNNLVSKRQMKSLVNIRQSEIVQLRNDLENFEATGIGPQLSAHTVDPDAHTALNTRFFQQTSFIASSAGIADAGKPIKLNASGQVDGSMLDLSDLTIPDDITLTNITQITNRSHGNLQNLLTDDHTQYVLADGTRTITGNQRFDGLIQLGGTTGSFPALKNSAAQLHARLADDSAYATFIAGAGIFTASVQAAGSSPFIFQGRSRLYSDIDSNIRLSNSTQTGFGLLQFGGTTSAFPALKRSGTELHTRLADDTNYADLVTGDLGVRISPLHTLTVQGNFGLTSSGVEQGVLGFLAGVQFNFRAGSGMDLSFGSNGVNDKMILKSDGKVQINTTTNTVGFLNIDSDYTALEDGIVLKNTSPGGSGRPLRILSFGGSETFHISADGRVRTNLGSAGFPMLTPQSDTNTGMYFDGADSIFYSTGGVKRMQIDAAGALILGDETYDIDFKVNAGASNNRRWTWSFPTATNVATLATVAAPNILAINGATGNIGLGVSPVNGQILEVEGNQGANFVARISNTASIGGQGPVLLLETGRGVGLSDVDVLRLEATSNARLMGVTNAGEMDVRRAVVGDTTITTSATLDVGGTTGAFMPPRLTTTQRDALTASDGMLIYNTSLAKFQGYENGAWVNLV